jgi:cytochrome c oxidase assembly factor CtaG
LKGLAIAGLIISQVSMCLPPLLVIGIPLNVTTWYLARLDLSKMSKGRMDPSGQKVTTDAKHTAVFAFAIAIIWIATWSMLILVLG